jgi:hypothetical protein
MSTTAIPVHVALVDTTETIAASDLAEVAGALNEQVQADSDGDWTVTASHELLEMLIDPFGSRLHTAAPPSGWKGDSPRLKYLMEAGDPCEETTSRRAPIAPR